MAWSDGRRELLTGVARASARSFEWPFQTESLAQLSWPCSRPLGILRGNVEFAERRHRCSPQASTAGGNFMFLALVRAISLRDSGANDCDQKKRAHGWRPSSVLFAGAAVDFTPVIERGDPRNVIVDAAAALGSDLIILAAPGRSSLERFLVIGSVGEGPIGRTARSDVLVIAADSGLEPKAAARSSLTLRRRPSCYMQSYGSIRRKPASSKSTPTKVEMAIVHAPGPHIHRHANEEDVRVRHHPDDEPRYFGEVAQALKDHGQVLLVGPSMTKLHLARYVQRHDHALEARIVGIESADHPTDAQLVAHLRHYFHESAHVARTVISRGRLQAGNRRLIRLTMSVESTDDGRFVHRRGLRYWPLYCLCPHAMGTSMCNLQTSRIRSSSLILVAAWRPPRVAREARRRGRHGRRRRRRRDDHRDGRHRRSLHNQQQSPRPAM